MMRPGQGRTRPSRRALDRGPARRTGRSLDPFIGSGVEAGARPGWGTTAAGGARCESLTTADPAMLQLTSGSTGEAKGVVLTHGNLICNARGVVARTGITPADRLLHLMPFHHTNGGEQPASSPRSSRARPSCSPTASGPRRSRTR